MKKADSILKAAAYDALTNEYCSCFPEDVYTHTFSEGFQRKMRRLIKLREKPYYIAVNTVAKRAACVIITLFAAASVTVMSVDALRTGFINFVVETFEKFSAVYASETENSPAGFEKIYEIGYKTDNFTLTYFASTDVYRHSIYSDGSDEIYFYQYIKDSFNIGVSADEYEITERTVNGCPALYYEKNGYRHIIWDDGAYVFCIYTSLNEDDAFKTAETIREIDENE